MKKAALLFLILALGAPVLTTPAQSVGVENNMITGKIIYYGKLSADGQEQIVTLTSNTKYVFELTKAQSRCISLSENLEYIAVSIDNNPQTLSVYRLESGDKVLEVPWDERWTSPCWFFWDDADTIYIYIHSTYDETEHSIFYNDTYFTLDVDSGKIVGPITRIAVRGGTRWDCRGYAYGGSPSMPDTTIKGFTCDEITAQLPNFVPGDYYLHFPNRNIFLYARCTGRQITGSMQMPPECDQFCSDVTEAVIYDLTNQKTLEILEDAPDFARDSYFIPSCVSEGAYKVGLSPSGRYLAYEADTDPFSIRVYDVDTDQYWESLVVNVESSTFYIDHAGISWSPDEQKFAFFTVPPPPELHETLERVLVVFNRETGALRIVEEVLKLRADLDILWWSPDSQTIAFINDPMERNLTLFDINTGDMAVLDDGVYGILSWTSE
ncbi:MAG: hypothetical protein JXB47_04790 [Anaerolineae bacterium]|nr:hypothetical protein [Anaerolineae bacterium]